MGLNRIIQDRENVVKNLCDASVNVRAIGFEQSGANRPQSGIALNFIFCSGFLIRNHMFVFPGFHEICRVHVDDLEHFVDELVGLVQKVLIIHFGELQDLEDTAV